MRISVYSFPGSHSNSHLSNQQAQEQVEAASFGHSGKNIKSNSYTHTYAHNQAVDVYVAK